MTRNFNHYNYFKSKTSRYSYNQNINIQPAFCGQTLGGHSFFSTDTDWIDTTSKITIYYQMGNTFKFIVPKSMTISNIVFDALDSSLLPTESWLKENARWCTISGTTLSVNSANPSPVSSWNVQTIQTEECKTTFGDSFFQFGYSDTLSNISGVGTLTLSNWVFQNFFYDFTSLIGLTKDYGNVVVTGSTFDKFSNWGSIIRDTREYPSLDYISSSTSSQAAITYRDSMFTINQLKNKYFVEPSTYCTSQSWSSISISSSTFTNFNYLKSGGHTYHKVSSSSNMGFQGIIMNLINFYGNVAVYNNSFLSLQFKYNNWEETSNVATTLDANNIWGTPSISQQKSIMNINIKSAVTEIYGNSFTQWSSFSGIIFIMRDLSFNGAVLIHNNIFTQSSAITGTNVLKIFLYSPISFYSSYTLSYMVWANVQISSNTFNLNVGWQYTRGIIEANWYTYNYDSSLFSLVYNNYYPNPPYSVMSFILSKQGVVSFSTVNNMTLPSSLQTIDTNKFLLSNNTYSQNFISSFRSLNEFMNFRRIHMLSETYIKNTGQSWESLNKYGSIKSICNAQSISSSNNFALYAYYGASDNEFTLFDYANINYLDQYYPVSPIIIQLSLYVFIDGIVFDNNSQQEVNTKYLNSQYPSGAITFRMCKGALYLNNLIIRNYKGFDQEILQTILGSDYSNVINYAPNERDSNGNPPVNASYPKYVMDYGIKNPLIKFARPSTLSDYDYANQFDVCSFNKLILSNITKYDPITSTPLFIDITDECGSISISNISISDVDSIRGQTSIFGLKNYGSIIITNGVIQNVNKNAYLYDTTGFSYVTPTGGVFIFNSLQSNSSYSSSVYSITNLTFKNIYARKGGAFYFGINSQVTTAHANSIALSSITIQDSMSYENGAISFAAGSQNVTITNSNFISNIGINWEADIRVVTTGSLQISNTTFKLFSSSNANSGQSMTIMMSTPFAFIVNVSNITVIWSNTQFSNTTYISYINSAETQLIKSSPILINPGSLQSSSSTFSSWFNSINGAVIQANSDSLFTDSGSTFTQNAAASGGALFLRKSTASLTNTVFTYNYAASGGAITLDSGSTISTFVGVQCNYNYANNGGWINSIGSSTLLIQGSTIKYNYAVQIASALYFLGASTTSITSTEISFNYAKSGDAVYQLFTPLTLVNVTFVNNIADQQSTWIFVAFSTLIVKNSTFKNTQFPNSTSKIENAAANSQVNGCFLSASSGATLTIIGSEFDSGYANNGGAIYVSGNSDVTISDSNFKNWYASISGGAIFAAGFQTFTLTNWNFEGNSWSTTGTDLWFKSGESHISNANFKLIAGPPSISLEGGKFYGININMSNLYPNNIVERNYYWMGPGIFGTSMNYFYLFNSSLSNLNYGTYGGAIYILVAASQNNIIPQNPTYIFDTCTFTSNSGIYGGAVYLEEVEYVSFNSCNFINNSAINYSVYGGGQGGAILYESTTVNSKVSFSNQNTFKNNLAQKSGGAIYWNYIQPDNVTNQIYTNNSALNYGNNYAWFAQRIQSITASEYNSLNPLR